MMNEVTITHAYQNPYDYDIICKNPHLQILEFAVAYEAESFYGKVKNPDGKISVCVWDKEGIPQCGFNNNYGDYFLVVIPNVLYVAVYYTSWGAHITGCTTYNFEEIKNPDIIEKVKAGTNTYQTFLGFVKIELPKIR